MTNPTTVNSQWVSWNLEQEFFPSTAGAGSPAPASAPIPQPTPTVQPATFEGRAGSHYFETDAHIAYFHSKRVNAQSWNMSHRAGPYWTEDDELSLVNKLSLTWFGEMWSDGNEWSSNAPELPLDKITPTIIPKRKLSPFKLNYQTFEEIRLRLMNTVILINGSPFYVSKIRQKQGKFILGVIKEDTVLRVNYDDLQDLRTIPPMYLTTNSTGWFCRAPARVYQQGVNRNNSHMRTIDGKGILYNIDSTSLIRAIDRRSDKVWHSSYESLMDGGDLQSVRLSDEIAIVGKDRLACYKGRPLGHVKDGEILCDDEDDLLQEWIDRSAKSVGLELKAA